MPKTKKQIFKYIENLIDPSFVAETHYYCAQCLLYWNKKTEDGESLQNDNLGNTEACSNCHCTMKKTFYTFPVECQLRHMFESGSLAENLEKARKQSSPDSDVMRDITDGSEYRKLQVEGYDVTLLWYVDGVKIYSSSEMDLWPIQFTICELPPHVRTMNIGVFGLWCDTAKPIMNTLLAPFANSLSEIQQKGGISWRHPVSGIQHKSSIFAPVACADAPARADIQNIMRHNAKYCCNTCEQKTTKLPLTPEEIKAKAAGHVVRRKRAFVFLEEKATLRDGHRMKVQANEATRRKKPVKGVKGRACVDRIQKLDVGKCVYAEYMHGVCLGVVRLFASLWLLVPGPWNIKLA